MVRVSVKRSRHRTFYVHDQYLLELLYHSMQSADWNRVFYGVIHGLSDKGVQALSVY
jgi:hypothetical protein